MTPEESQATGQQLATCLACRERVPDTQTCNRLGNSFALHVLQGGRCPIGKHDALGTLGHYAAGAYRALRNATVGPKTQRTEAEIARIKSICAACDRSTPWGGCSVCGCIYSLKVLDANEHCPQVPAKW